MQPPAVHSDPVPSIPPPPYPVPPAPVPVQSFAAPSNFVWIIFGLLILLFTRVPVEGVKKTYKHGILPLKALPNFLFTYLILREYQLLRDTLLRPIFVTLPRCIFSAIIKPICLFLWTHVALPIAGLPRFIAEQVVLRSLKALLTSVIKPMFVNLPRWLSRNVVTPFAMLLWNALVWTWQQLVAPATLALWKRLVQPILMLPPRLFFGGVMPMARHVRDNILRPVFVSLPQLIIRVALIPLLRLCFSVGGLLERALYRMGTAVRHAFEQAVRAVAHVYAHLVVPSARLIRDYLLIPLCVTLPVFIACDVVWRSCVLMMRCVVLPAVVTLPRLVWRVAIAPTATLALNRVIVPIIALPGFVLQYIALPTALLIVDFILKPVVVTLPKALYRGLVRPVASAVYTTVIAPTAQFTYSRLLRPVIKLPVFLALNVVVPIAEGIWKWLLKPTFVTLPDVTYHDVALPVVRFAYGGVIRPTARWTLQWVLRPIGVALPMLALGATRALAAWVGETFITPVFISLPKTLFDGLVYPRVATPHAARRPLCLRQVARSQGARSPRQSARLTRYHPGCYGRCRIGDKRLDRNERCSQRGVAIDTHRRPRRVGITSAPP